MGHSYSRPHSETTTDVAHDDDDNFPIDECPQEEEAFQEGEFVEARWKGGHRWYSAVITRAHIDGTYDIRYKDGSREIYIDPEFIRRKENFGGPSTERPAIFEVGEFVEVRWKGGQRWYSALITRTHMDGTYDIRYSDGDREIYLDPEFIRRKS